MPHELARLPRITTGVGARARLGALAAAQCGDGARLMLVADPGLARLGRADEIAAVLRAGGHDVLVFTDFSADPSIAQTDAAASLARTGRVAGVVALGGGSALDLGKAVAAIAPGVESALAYELCKTEFPARRLKAICVPTTSGTGSELTRTAVLTRADKAKVWLWGEAIKADEVVLDPEQVRGLPPDLTAATGIDALVHAVEAATNNNAHDANNVFAHEAIRLVARNLESAVADGGDLVARAALQRAAALAGAAIAHNVGHALASLRPVHHGRAVGVAMLATNAWNVADDDGRWAACGAALGVEASARGFVAGFERLIRAVGVKILLGEELAGVTAEQLAAQMRAPENAPMRNSNHRASSEQDLLAIATRVLTQA